MNIINKIKVKLSTDQHLSEIIKGGSFTFISQILASVFGLFSSILIARYYGAEIIGVVSILGAIISMVSLVGLAGLNVALLKLIPKNMDNGYFIYKQVITLSFILSILVGLLLFFISPYLSTYFFTQDSNQIFLTVLSILLYPFVFLSIGNATLRGFSDIKAFAFFSFVPSLLRFLLLIVITLFVDDKYIPVYLMFIIPLITDIFLFIYINRKYAIDKIKKIMPNKKLLFLSLPMMLTEGMYLVIANSDTLMLAYYTNEKETGIYSISIGLVLMTTIIISAIQSFSAPKFSELYHTNKIKELKILAVQTSKLTFFTLMPIAIILIVFGEWLLKTVYGVEFVLGYHPMVIVVVAYIIKSSSGLVGIFLNMTGHEKVYSYIAFFSALLNILLNYILIPKYGLNGAAFATAISIVIWSLLSVIYIYKKFNFIIAYIPRMYRQRGYHDL